MTNVQQNEYLTQASIMKNEQVVMKSMNQLNDSVATQEGTLSPMTRGSVSIKGGNNIMVSNSY